ncbi:MAG: type II toxin-antitoxin system RelE/ParE family toxin [Rhodospirillaceae bacterium]|nr:type II toxin-antitoxin system RelE/ParE family toxin [Rhodospirillaceae bacterium]MBT5664987.1 type II toxin-antitoxin system RelE/ParE family toxin [Rhodospirillaceae bacterium]MBT5809187.1 type II toxin-antitoxin system RelE/ParE family toxin [Rhodospirillaceae bacterium]
MSKYRTLRVSDSAKADLKQIGNYTRRKWGAAQTRKYLGGLRDKFKALTNSPGLGAPRDEIATNLRALPVGKHIIYYRETDDNLEILRVLHKSMDVAPLKN